VCTSAHHSRRAQSVSGLFPGSIGSFQSKPLPNLHWKGKVIEVRTPN
jgi:hypothetical protein